MARVPRTKLLTEPLPPVAWLVILSGRRKGTDERLSPVTTIGREGAYNTIHLEDEMVSGEHAKIKYENGQFVLYDLGTTNGTFVNGKRVVRQPLMDEDVIVMGETILVFKEVKGDKLHQ